MLVINYLFILEFGFTQQTFPIITIALIGLGIGLYIFLSKSLLDPLFKSDEQIQNMIKETLHELNTPVSTIQINTTMLQRKAEDTKDIQRLERIEQACANLLALYNQMEYSIKKEVDNISDEKFNLKELIQKSISNFDDIKNNITITETIANDISLKTDKNGFEKVINNLISNAIKYNKSKGYVLVDFKDNILSIKDSGIGIKTENLFQVFDKYYQQDITHDGIGLGLNIVKEFCDKHKIKINIDSDIKNGTTFYFDVVQIRV